MPWKPKPVKDKSKVIKILMLEKPMAHESGEGDYELRFGHRPKEPETHDVISLQRFLLKVWPDRADHILDRLYNFGKIYLNLDTKEIST